MELKALAKTGKLITGREIFFRPVLGVVCYFQQQRAMLLCFRRDIWINHIRHTLTFFLSFFQVMGSDVVILLETDHKGLPPTWLRPGVAVINLSSALMEGIFLQSKDIKPGIHYNN